MMVSSASVVPEAGMRGWLFTRHLFALALLAAATAAGCEKGSLGGDMSGGTGKGGSGESASCAAVMNADGTVCKQCVDANGAIVYESCAPAPTTTGAAGTTGTGGTGAAGAAGTGGAAGGSRGGACLKITDGGPTSCKDSATWKMYGLAACAQQNLTLTDIGWDIACPGYSDHYQQVTYVCCGGCTTTVDATGVTCKTCTDATGAVMSSECSGGGGTCEASTGPDGAACKTCRDGNGKIVSAECNDGGTGATEICDVRTQADGSTCKVCWEPDGSMISTCPPDPPAK
jgi:hypothetical protein